MAKSIYVGNLPFETTGEDLAQLFRTFGSVTSGEVIIDRFSGRSRGFGFVEMSSDDEADQAIEALNGQSQGGRPLIVNEARPHAESPRLEFPRADEPAATAEMDAATEVAVISKRVTASVTSELRFHPPWVEVVPSLFLSRRRAAPGNRP